MAESNPEIEPELESIQSSIVTSVPFAAGETSDMTTIATQFSKLEVPTIPLCEPTFLGIPLEIRNKIYKAFINERQAKAADGQIKCQALFFKEIGNLVPLHLTCRQVLEEFGRCLGNLALICDYYDLLEEPWTHPVPAVLAKKIKQLTLTITEYCWFANEEPIFPFTGKRILQSLSNVRYVEVVHRERLVRIDVLSDLWSISPQLWKHSDWLIDDKSTSMSFTANPKQLYLDFQACQLNLPADEFVTAIYGLDWPVRIPTGTRQIHSYFKPGGKLIGTLEFSWRDPAADNFVTVTKIPIPSTYVDKGDLEMNEWEMGNSMDEAIDVESTMTSSSSHWDDECVMQTREFGTA